MEEEIQKLKIWLKKVLTNKNSPPKFSVGKIKAKRDLGEIPYEGRIYDLSICCYSGSSNHAACIYISKERLDDWVEKSNDSINENKLDSLLAAIEKSLNKGGVYSLERNGKIQKIK